MKTNNWNEMSEVEKCRYELEVVNELECVSCDVKNKAKTDLLRLIRTYERYEERAKNGK